EALPGEATENTGTVRYEIRNGTLTKLQDLGEQDMSLGSTLENFTEWAVTKCPAPKTALIIWNHGTGDSGVGVDESSNGKQLSLGAIRQALENVQNKTGNALDVLGFDACHMGASEVFTEFSGLAKVLIGSQEVEPGDGWDYESILDGLKDAPEEVDHERFGTIVVETYERWYRSTGRNKTTLAAYDLADAPKFTSAMSTLTDCLVKALQNETTAAEMARAIEWARNESKSFKGNDQIDLYDFLGHLQQATDDVDIRRKAQDVRGIIERMRIAQHVGTAAGDAFGISIYFDHNSSITYTWSKGTALKFNDSTSWEQVIKLYNGFYKNATHRTWLRNNPINASSRLDVIGSLSGPVTPGESILDDLSTSGLTVKPTIKVDTFANFSHLDFWMSEPGSRLPPYLLGSFPIESVNGLDIPVPDVPGGWYDIWGTPRVPGAFLDPAIGSDVIFGDPLWVPGPEPLLNPQFFNPPGFESEGYTPPIFGPGDTIVTPIQIFNYGGVTSPDAPLEVIWYDSDGAVILVENFNPGPIAPGRYTCEIQQPGTLVDVLSNSPRDQATPTCDYQVQDPNQYDMRFEIQGNESQSYFDPSLIGSPVNFYVTTPTFDPALVFFVHYLIAGEPLIFDSYLYTNMAIEVNNLTPGFDSPGGYTYNVSLPAWGFDQYDTQFYGGYDYFVGLFTSLTAGNLLPAKYHSFYAPVAGLAPLVSIDDLTVTPAPCGSPWTLDVTMTNHGQVDANITYFYYDLYPYSDEWILYNSDHDG
ncbi:MAG: clostripain-related cysteine peptidase, partial [Candidatus Kariarchaeaceae archaeon]